MQANLERTFRTQLSELVDRQTALFNADAPEAERVAVHEEITALQRLRKKSEG